MNILKCENLTKSYGNVKALNGFSFTVSRGSITGLLGPNGAGKTTTLKIINGLITKYGGEVEIFGEKISPGNFSYRRKIGFVPEDFSLYEYMRGTEIIEFNGELTGKSGEKIIENLQNTFKLPLERKIATYSRGMKKLLSLYLALQTNPELLVLDEPTDGLDPIIRSKLFDFIFDYVSRFKTTILFSSHILSEIERISDRVVFIKNGKRILEEDIDSLKENSALFVVKAKSENAEIPDFVIYEKKDDFIEIRAIGNAKETEEKLLETNFEIIEKIPLTFEEIVVNYMEAHK
ncbi:MAG: ABC transporter ATP-binding protein [Caldisericaceae bacterium]|nr:ABC transporter ATP-binding protein [Caldisericaceae bacterium]